LLWLEPPLSSLFHTHTHTHLMLTHHSLASDSDSTHMSLLPASLQQFLPRRTESVED
jgi:hypothetical protein